MACELLKFWVVKPSAATNLVTNPSFETGTTSWSASGSNTIAQSDDQQRRGAWSAICTYQDNATLATYAVTLTDAAHVVSAAVYVPDAYDGTDLSLTFENFASATITAGAVDLTLTDQWQRVHATITPDSGDLSGNITLTEGGSPTAAVYVYLDAVLLELGSTPTTYFDGDSRGFVPTRNDFYWTGTRHASTSVRTAKTRAGGELMFLGTDLSDDYRILQTSGLGMGPINLSWNDLVTGGGIYEGYTSEQRTFGVSLSMNANTTIGGIMAKRKEIIDALRPDLVDEQPLVIRAQGFDSSDAEATEPMDIVCVPFDGFTNLTESPILNQDVIMFQALDAYLPGAYQEGVELDFADSVTDADYIIQRDADGNWSGVGGGLSDEVNKIYEASDGKVYIGGAFTNAGDANGDGIVYWDGSAFNSMGSGLGGGNGIVYDIIEDAAGNIYAVGDFTDGGGVSGADYIAKWNGSTWAKVGDASDFTDRIHCIAINSTGLIYVGGAFLNAHANANADFLAKWTGSAWTNVGNALNNVVYAIAIDKSDNVYIGGAFTNAGAIAEADYIARHDGSSYSALGDGLSAVVRALAFDNAGNLYIGGNFENAGSNGDADKIAKWTGTQYEALTPGYTVATSVVYSLDYIKISNSMYVSGLSWTSSPAGSYVYVWNGSDWQDAEVALPGTPFVYSTCLASDGTLYIGFSTSGTATGAGVETATNNGGANVYPTIRVEGPGTLYQIQNYTTGKQVTFESLALLTGEVATFDFNPDNLRFISTYRGRLDSYLSVGSDKASFHLQPGANELSMLMTGTDANTEVVMYWTPRFWSLDQAVRE